MTLPALLNLIGLFLGLLAGGFFIFGASEMKAQDIAALSESAWDANPGFRAYLVNQKADYLNGAFAFLAAFVFQLLGAAPGSNASKIEIVPNDSVGVAIAVTFSALVGVLLWLNRRRVVRNLNAELQQF